MYKFYFAAALGLICSGIMVPPVIAAQIGQSSGGSAFSCDADLNECTCSGSARGADCQAMAKNCKGATKQSDGTYKNYVLECATGSAACREWKCEMSRRSKTLRRFRPKISVQPNRLETK